MDAKISFYNSCRNPAEKTEIELSKVFDLIKSDKLKAITQQLREEPSKELRTKIKADNLPSVIFQGTFFYRNNESLKESSGLSVIDIDSYSDGSLIKEAIIKDKYVYACFLSPSGGVKVLIKIPKINSDIQYKKVYGQLINHFKQYSPKNDDSTKDISRLCFLSYDPDLYINETALEFPVNWSADQQEKQQTKEEPIRDESRSAKEYREIVRLLRKGKTKSEIFQEMQTFAKWVSSPLQYKEITYNKAADFVAQEETKKEDKKEQKEENDNTIQKSFIEHEGIIYEQVVNNKYVYRKDGIFQYCDSVIIDGLKYVPCSGEELTKGSEAVILSSEPLDYESLQSLVKEIQNFIHEWLDVSPEFEVFAAWYVVLTWVYDRVPTINYLSAMGDIGTGKSRFLNVIARICYKPIIGSGAVSVAALKRMINKWR